MSVKAYLPPDEASVLVGAIDAVESRGMSTEGARELRLRPHAATHGDAARVARSLAMALGYPYIDMGPGHCDRCHTSAWPSIMAQPEGTSQVRRLCTTCLPPGVSYVPTNPRSEWMRAALVEHGFEIPDAADILSGSTSLLAQAILDRGLTAAHLSDRLNIAADEAEAIVRGDIASISAVALLRCAAALQCEVEALVDGADLALSEWIQAEPGAGLDLG